MAHCVISMAPCLPHGGLVATCFVHEQHAPCGHDGQPAFPAVVHLMLGRKSRAHAIRLWELRTERQRPAVLHYDNGDPAREGHQTGPEYTACRCGAEYLPAGEA